MTEKIRALFLAANVVDGKYYARLDEEAREIDGKIQQGTRRDYLEVISRWAVRPSDLQKHLLRHQPHIVHFSGHGSKTELLVREGVDASKTYLYEG